MTKCTAIIPYYQHEPGILRRALKSVFAQTHENVEVIVVDDSSPVSAQSELADFSLDQRTRIVVVKQPNAGPGAARNTGLDHLSADTDLVAFLDSDDEWTPDHLANAVAALSLFDADCYWASISGDGDFSYHFGVEGISGMAEVVRLSEHPSVIEVPDLAGVMLKDWAFLHLSCMVIGRPLFSTKRFEATLRLAAEDVLFFCDCVRAAKRTILGEMIGATRGQGVNIFHAIGNDSPQFLKQQFNTWTALDHLENRYAHSPRDRASIHANKQAARRQALWGQVGLMRRRKAPQLGLLAQWAWRDPRILRSALELAVAKISR